MIHRAMTSETLPATFDPLANDYDASFTDTPVGRVLRNIVWSHAGNLFRAGQRVLELGCGTGEDAAEFARRGITMVATDASAEMIELAQRKAAGRRSSDRMTFRCMAMENVGVALANDRFDAVFSNFGAINCVGDLRALAADLAKLLAPGAPLLWVVMGRHVPWEWLWYGVRGQGRKALRRLRTNGVQWRGATVRYPSPTALGEMLLPHFRVSNLLPLGCALPPSYAAGWLNRSPRILAALSRIELAAQAYPFLAHISDHYILEARRTDAE